VAATSTALDAEMDRLRTEVQSLSRPAPGPAAG